MTENMENMDCPTSHPIYCDSGTRNKEYCVREEAHCNVSSAVASTMDYHRQFKKRPLGWKHARDLKKIKQTVNTLKTAKDKEEEEKNRKEENDKRAARRRWASGTLDATGLIK